MLHKKKKIGADRHATMHVFAWCVSTGCSPAMPSGEGVQSTVYADTDCVPQTFPQFIAGPDFSPYIAQAGAVEGRDFPDELQAGARIWQDWLATPELRHRRHLTRYIATVEEVHPGVYWCTGQGAGECRVRIVRLRWNGYGGRTGENDHGVHELWLHNFTHQYPPLALSRQGRWGIE
jgi:hypothetical protein